MGHWKKVSEGGRLEKNMFWPVLTCFWPVYLQFDGFFGFSKKSGRDCRKNFFWPKSDSSHVKRDIKAKKKKHPLCLKNPAEIQEMSFGQGRSLFFNLFLAYTTQLECKIIISLCSAEIRRDGWSGWAGWASAHPDFGRREGAVAMCQITTFGLY